MGNLDRKTSSSDLVNLVYSHPLIHLLGKYPSYINPTYFVKALLEQMFHSEEISPSLIQAKLKEYQGNQFAQAIIIFLKEESDLSNRLSNIEIWFIDLMRNVSGGYKRRVQLIVFGIASIIVCTLNYDTIRVFRVMSRNSTVKNVLAIVKDAATSDEQKKVSLLCEIDSMGAFQKNSGICYLSCVSLSPY